MSTPGYHITAELRLKDIERLQEARQALAELSARTLTEPGCSLFTVHHDAATPTRFVLWERFDDEQAFKKHFDEAHTKAYVALDLTEVVQYFQTDVLTR